ncbi:MULTISPECIES: 3-hydroxylacyl-ACP dehydratase [unclassified Streptomyces]|uniref:3-hydroxyacyl-ACP dehydratase FabZ family protein n=1 Tax=unclassified Streptomyces TaxID=2593676 RepID=UPI003328FFFA
MRFHLIDRIDSWTPHQHITARKVTSVHEDLWQRTPDGPRLPLGLSLEALCQAGTWLIMLSTDHRSRAALLTVGEVVGGAPVRPGDVLRMEAHVVSSSGEAAVVDGRVTSGGRTVLEARGIMCALIDAEELDDPEDTRRMARMLLGDKAPAAPVGAAL